MSVSPAAEEDLAPMNDVDLPNGHVQDEAMMDVDQQEREESTGSASSGSGNQKRKRETNGVVHEPIVKVPRRTKRTVSALVPPTSSRERSRSGGTARKPNVARRAPIRRTRATADDGESALVEEIGETRCVCGLNDEDNWDGFMLQCETCNCWQHGMCVGIADEKDAPRSYFCEQCRPDLHPDSYPVQHLEKQQEGSDLEDDGDSPSKLRESADAAMVSHFLHKGARRKSDEDKPVYPPTSHFAEPKNPGRRRSTMNSRDAAYEESLAQALALSQQDSSGMTRQGSKSRSATQETDERPSQKRRVASRARPKKQSSMTMAAAATPTPPPVDEPVLEQEMEQEDIVAPVLPEYVEEVPECAVLFALRWPSFQSAHSDEIETNGRDVSPPRSPSPAESDMPLSRPMRKAASRNGKPMRGASPDESSDDRSGSQPPPNKPRHHNQYTKARALNGEKAVRPSPNKRSVIIAKDTDGDDSSVPLAAIAAARKRKPKASASHANIELAAAKAAAVVAVANAVAFDEAEMTESRHSTNPWHLPAHLEHLAASLGTPPTTPLHPKPKYPTKRATVADMRKRTIGLLKYLERSSDMLDKLSVPEPSNGKVDAATLIAELQSEVKSWQEKFTDMAGRSQTAVSAEA